MNSRQRRREAAARHNNERENGVKKKHVEALLIWCYRLAGNERRARRNHKEMSLLLVAALISGVPTIVRR